MLERVGQDKKKVEKEISFDLEKVVKAIAGDSLDWYLTKRCRD